MSKRILLVDDEADFAFALQKTIEQAGYIVESAHNGREAVGAYIQSLHTNKPFSLILLDIRLPYMNGVEVLDVIRKEELLRGMQPSNGVPVIMMTAYDKPWMDPSLVQGCADYVLKSASNEELLKKIREKLK
jgi:CheY-like chemotaxis protein